MSDVDAGRTIWSGALTMGRLVTAFQEDILKAWEEKMPSLVAGKGGPPSRIQVEHLATLAAEVCAAPIIAASIKAQLAAMGQPLNEDGT